MDKLSEHLQSVKLDLMFKLNEQINRSSCCSTKRSNEADDLIGGFIKGNTVLQRFFLIGNTVSFINERV